MLIPLLPFIGFAIAASVTPGPNNIMVAASAARNGVRATVPHMFGIAAGFGVMILIVGLGLAAPLARLPLLQSAMRWVGLIWLVYLAWQIAIAAPPEEGPARPLMGFGGGALFQWINPKAWLMALDIATSWVSVNHAAMPQVMLMALVFVVVGVPSNLVWAGIGARAGSLLRTRRRLRWFNGAMAALLIASIIPLVVGG